MDKLIESGHTQVTILKSGKILAGDLLDRPFSAGNKDSIISYRIISFSLVHVCVIMCSQICHIDVALFASYIVSSMLIPRISVSSMNQYPSYSSGSSSNATVCGVVDLGSCNVNVFSFLCILNNLLQYCTVLCIGIKVQNYAIN